MNLNGNHNNYKAIQVNNVLLLLIFVERNYFVPLYLLMTFPWIVSFLFNAKMVVFVMMISFLMRQKNENDFLQQTVT